MKRKKVPEFRTDARKEKFRSVIEKRQPSLTIVLENVHDPHNVSAVLRSCDAVGVYDVHLVYNGGQVFPKLGEKSSASARKWLRINQYDNIEECYHELRKQKKKIFTTRMEAGSDALYDLNLVQPVALVFGNEHSGISDEAWQKADGNFIIPQVGIIQSLNISVACAVSLYEAFRQRFAAGMFSQSQFTLEEQEIVLREWLSK